MNQLFAKKKLEDLLAEMAGEHRLNRVLGPVALTSLGVGAIIGTGIFVMIGTAARNDAGPGLILSFVIAGLACLFAALCYSEFAAMAPVAGSAYTYAYTTMGELMAWIIGWDLVLEYAMGSAAVANGWSKYLMQFFGLFFKPETVFAAWLTIDPFTAATQHRDYLAAEHLEVVSATAKYQKETYQLPLPVDSPITRVDEVTDIVFTPASIVEAKKYGEKADEEVATAMKNALKYNPKAIGSDPTQPPLTLAAVLDHVRDSNKHGYDAYMTTPISLGGWKFTTNIVSIIGVAIMTVVLVIGIRESAGFNAAMVIVKLAAVLFVIFAGVWWIEPANYDPFLPYGMSGVMTAAGVVFFAYIGFDSVSTHSEEAKNPQRDVPIGIVASLVISTVLYIIVAAVVTGMVPYPQIPIDAPISGIFRMKGLAFANAIIVVGALTGITSVLLVMLLSQPRVLLAMARDGLLPQSFFGAVHPRFKTPHKSTILTGCVAAIASSMFPIDTLGHMVSIGTLFAFVVVCLAVWIMRFTNPQAERPFRTPFLHFVAPAGITLCLSMMIYLGVENWIRLIGWLAIGLVIYFVYSRHHSLLGKKLREEITKHGISPAGSPQ